MPMNLWWWRTRNGDWAGVLCQLLSSHRPGGQQTRNSEWSVIVDKVLTETKTCLPEDCMIVLFKQLFEQPHQSMPNLRAIDPLLLKVFFKCFLLASCPINKCTFLDRYDLFVVTKGLALSWMWNMGGKRQLGYKCPDSRAHSTPCCS